MPKRSKYWDAMVDIFEEHFPKGECNERGAALLMLAEIEMLLIPNKGRQKGDLSREKTN